MSYYPCCDSKDKCVCDYLEEHSNKTEEKEDKSLIVWLPNGETMKFEKVTNLMDLDSELTFDYFGVSTQVARQATFNMSKITGFALEV